LELGNLWNQIPHSLLKGNGMILPPSSGCTLYVFLELFSSQKDRTSLIVSHGFSCRGQSLEDYFALRDLPTVT
jgi:hypothetical protein